MTSAVIIKIDRLARLPKARFSKLLANWTYVESLRFKFGGLGVDVRNLTHYRVVTIMVSGCWGCSATKSAFSKSRSCRRAGRTRRSA